MRIVQSGKGRTYIQREKLSRRLSFFCGRLRERGVFGWLEDEKSEGLKKLVKVKVAGDQKAEICSVRKEERRREVFAG